MTNYYVAIAARVKKFYPRGRFSKIQEVNRIYKCSQSKQLTQLRKSRKLMGLTKFLLKVIQAVKITKWRRQSYLTYSPPSKLFGSLRCAFPWVVPHVGVSVLVKQLPLSHPCFCKESHLSKLIGSPQWMLPFVEFLPGLLLVLHFWGTGCLLIPSSKSSWHPPREVKYSMTRHIYFQT